MKMKKGKRKLFRLFTVLICASLLFTMLPATAYAVTGVTIYYEHGNTEDAASLTEAIATANASANTANRAERIVLSAGTFAPTADNQLRITIDNLTIEGAGQSVTTIDTGAFAVSGQAGLMVSADNVTVKDLTVTSGGSNAISAIKITEASDCTIQNVAIDSMGSGIDTHSATDVNLTGVTIENAGKVGFSIADATGVIINNCTTVNITWGADIGLMYNSSSPASYDTPCDVTLTGLNTFDHNTIASERPSAAQGGPDVVKAPGWVMTNDFVFMLSASWAMKPIGSDPIPFVDEADDINFSSFDLACRYSPNGSTITMQGDIPDELIIPALASGRDLIIDGGGHTLSGGLSTHTGANLSSLTIQNFDFADSVISITTDIGDVNINENSFIDSGSVTEPFVQVSGSAISGNVDMTYNYWDGLNPYTAMAGALSIADISGAPNTTKTVFPYYLDTERTILVGEDDAWITPKSATFDKNVASKDHKDIPVTLVLGEATLGSITCEGSKLTEGNDYTMKGNVYTFSKEWMSTLSAGKHTIAFNLSDGKNVNFELTVNDTTPAPADNNSDDQGGAPDSDDQADEPQTGDYSSISTWIMLALIALCGIVIAFYARKRIHNKFEP